MTSRTYALLLTLVGGGLLFFRAPQEAAFASGLLGAALGLWAIWLTSGRVRRVLAVAAAVAWAGALLLALSASLEAVLASALGLAGAALTVLRGADWPGWSSRYARSADIGEEEEVSPRMMWESLDKGMDPTRHADASSDD